MRSIYLVYGTTCFAVVVAETNDQAREQVSFKALECVRVGTGKIGQVEAGAHR